MTLTEIEKLAKEYSDARENLKGMVDDVESEMAAIKKKYLKDIRRAVERAAEKKTKLSEAIAEVPELFKKPKTVIFHGIRLGYQKAKGEISWEDEAKVIQLIKKHFPDDYEAYIKITEKILKTNLGMLPGSDLKKLGVTVTETGDEVFIKPTDPDIDKMINALLKDDEIEREAA